MKHKLYFLSIILLLVFALSGCFPNKAKNNIPIVAGEYVGVGHMRGKTSNEDHKPNIIMDVYFKIVLKEITNSEYKEANGLNVIKDQTLKGKNNTFSFELLISPDNTEFQKVNCNYIEYYNDDFNYCYRYDRIRIGFCYKYTSAIDDATADNTRISIGIHNYGYLKEHYPERIGENFQKDLFIDKYDYGYVGATLESNEGGKIK